MKKIQKQRTDTLGRKRRHIRASAALGKRELERERERELFRTRRFVALRFLSLFLSFFGTIYLSLFFCARGL